MCLIRELSVGNRKINSLVNRWPKDLDRLLTEEHRRLANQHVSTVHSARPRGRASGSSTRGPQEGHCLPHAGEDAGPRGSHSGLGGREGLQPLWRTVCCQKSRDPRVGENPGLVPTAAAAASMSGSPSTTPRLAALAKFPHNALWQRSLDLPLTLVMMPNCFSTESDFAPLSY